MASEPAGRPAAVLFDIDGTLVDSNGLHAEAWAVAFRHFGCDVAFDAVRAQIGKGGDNLVPAIAGKAWDRTHGDALRAWRGELFKRDYLPRVRAFPGVCDLFRRLRSDGVRVALASSAKGEELDHHRELLGCDELIAAAITADDVESSKPDPDIFAAALEKLKVRAERAIAVGDTPYDIAAAARAGVRTIAVRSGGFPDEALRGAGCVALYDGIADLLANYASSPLGSR